MTRRPERLKATKLYGSKQVADNKHDTVRKTPANGCKQADSKKLEISRRRPNQNDLNVKSALEKGLPKGFVTREEMEQKISKRKPLDTEKDKKTLLNQTNTLADSKATKNENACTKVPIGFVTREEMEQRINERKPIDKEKDKKPLHNQTTTVVDSKTTTNENASTKIPVGFVTKEEMEQRINKRKSIDAEKDKKPLHNHTNTVADGKPATNENASTKVPTGFVTKEEMEQRINKRKSIDAEKDKTPLHNQTNTLADSQTKRTTKENASTKIPQGFVTREDMEARITNRKTKQTKITPTYTQNNPKEQTNE